MSRGRSRHRPSAVQRELRHLIGRLVDEPDEVRIRESAKGSETLFQVRVDRDDLGKVIGRQGRTAEALRTVLEIRGDYDDRDYGLEIRES